MVTHSDPKHVFTKVLGLTPHHVGWAVEDLDVAAAGLRNLGYASVPELPDIIDGNFNVRLRFLRHPENPLLVEFVAPEKPGSPIINKLRKNGPGVYHMGYTVGNLLEAAAGLRHLGFHPVTPVFQAPAFAGREIQFLHHRHLGLIELIASL